MPLRGAGRNPSRPITLRPAGLSDTADASNNFAGAMLSLSNLVPDPTTDKCWVPRPAAISETTFLISETGDTHSSTTLDNLASTARLFTGMKITGSGIPANTTITVASSTSVTLSNAATTSLTGATFVFDGTYGFISSLLVIGDIAYGTIASARNSGKDEPFAYNLAGASFLTINGITSANVPTSPATTGDWTPPILCQVGSRIIVTHPGFPGGATKFGWFDLSGANIVTTGNTNTSVTITGNPSILGVQPGDTISDGGVNIPAGTSVVSTANFVLVESGTTHTNTTLDGLASTVGLAVGQTVVGASAMGIPSGATIAAVGSGSITLSAAATASATGSVTFAGATITMSAAATGSAGGASLTIAGGTTTAPLWGAGDTDRNNLPSVPVGVAQFNGRAYYALGVNGIMYSDSLIPCRVSNATVVQALTTDDGLAVTALAPLFLSTPITGGIVQAIIVFEGVTKMQQITGDPATSNLSMNALNVATGTNSPLSITPCELGTAFISPTGLRIINYLAQIGPPIGDHGEGITRPFIDAINPSRICAAASVDSIRISVINGAAANNPSQEYVWDLTRKVWHGPHTFPASLIQPWRDQFLMTAVGINAELWASDIAPDLSSTYTENGTALQWAYETALLPDNSAMEMNSVTLSALMIGLVGQQTVNVFAYDESGNIIQSCQISGLAAAGGPTVWGTFVWGQALWGGTPAIFRQRSLPWPDQVVFKQMTVAVTGASLFGTKVGNLYLKYQVLGYQLPEGV